MPKVPKGLTEKQKIFCREYIIDWNASRAARVAGYSEATAGAIGAENLEKPQIQAYIEEIQKDLEKVAGISRLKIVNELQKIAFGNIAHLHKTWWSRKEFEDLTDEEKACIQEITTSTKTIDGTPFAVESVKIKLYSKLSAIESLNKMFGYNAPEKVEVNDVTEEQVYKIGDTEITF